MMATDGAELTLDEAAQYDRQIRLWGVDAQKRMRSAKILVAGVRALTAEVCKNIVLAGVGKVVLCDHRSISEDDLTGNFLIGEDQLGKNRAESSLARLQVLNPHVQITADIDDIASKPDSFFLDFDIVVLTDATPNTIARVSALCRLHKKKFFCGDLYGYYGYSFADLAEHECLSERKVRTGEDKDAEEQTVLEPVTVNFCSWDQALNKNWAAVKNLPRELRHTSWLYFALQVLHRFQDGKQRMPDRHSSEDLDELVAMKNALLQEKGLATTVVSDDAMRLLGKGATVCLSPVAAIVGGVLAQEILKAASGKDKPHNNFFFYDGFENAGTVECHC